MISFGSRPSSSRNVLERSRKVTRSSAAWPAMISLIESLMRRRGSSAVAPRGKTASSSTFVFGCRRWISETIRPMPSAVRPASSRRWPVLLVPIITTASFGSMSSMAPFWIRQMTCSVRSPPKPRLSAFRFA